MQGVFLISVGTVWLCYAELCKAAMGEALDAFTSRH